MLMNARAMGLMRRGIREPKHMVDVGLGNLVWPSESRGRCGGRREGRGGRAQNLQKKVAGVAQNLQNARTAWLPTATADDALAAAAAARGGAPARHAWCQSLRG